MSTRVVGAGRPSVAVFIVAVGFLAGCQPVRLRLEPAGVEAAIWIDQQPKGQTAGGILDTDVNLKGRPSRVINVTARPVGTTDYTETQETFQVRQGSREVNTFTLRLNPAGGPPPGPAGPGAGPPPSSPPPPPPPPPPPTKSSPEGKVRIPRPREERYPEPPADPTTVRPPTTQRVPAFSDDDKRRMFRESDLTVILTDQAVSKLSTGQTASTACRDVFLQRLTELGCRVVRDASSGQKPDLAIHVKSVASPVDRFGEFHSFEAELKVTADSPWLAETQISKTEHARGQRALKEHQAADTAHALASTNAVTYLTDELVRKADRLLAAQVSVAGLAHPAEADLVKEALQAIEGVAGVYLTSWTAEAGVAEFTLLCRTGAARAALAGLLGQLSPIRLSVVKIDQSRLQVRADLVDMTLHVTNLDNERDVERVWRDLLTLPGLAGSPHVVWYDKQRQTATFQVRCDAGLVDELAPRLERFPSVGLRVEKRLAPNEYQLRRRAFR